MIVKGPRRDYKSLGCIAITYLFSSFRLEHQSHIKVFATPEKCLEILNFWDFTQTPSIDNALSFQSTLDIL